VFDPGAPGILEIATAGGYFYAITTENGEIISYSSNADTAALAPGHELPSPQTGQADYINTTSSDGDNLRIYVRPIQTRQGVFFLQVGRSIEPEQQAVRQLALILIVGAGVAFALAMAGGFWLAGRALKPIQTAMDKQQ
jgi:hypothetical protein